MSELRVSAAPLVAENLSCGYGGRAVLESVSFSAVPGELTVLIGPNGAGKSTLLKTLLGQLPPLAGRVLLEGRDLSALGDRDRARRMAAVLTGTPRPERLRCRELVEMGRYPYTGRLGLLGPEDRSIAREAMALVGTEDLADRDFTKLSDGQRQRVLLARALCQQPRVLLMDEPTSFLDLRHKLEFLDLLQRLCRERGMAAVLSLHELELAQRCAGRLLCLRDGRLDRTGPPEEVFKGDYIRALYGLTRGDYNPLLGCPEAPAPEGTPEVFVVGGGGNGIPVYRLLARLGIPFAAGVLPESDADCPVARSLAVKVLTVPPFTPVTSEAAETAITLAGDCRCVIDVCPAFHAENEENRRVLDAAEQRGTLRRASELPGCLEC